MKTRRNVVFNVTKRVTNTVRNVYASLPLPRCSILSPIEAAIKNMASAVTWPLKQKKYEESRVPHYKRVGRARVVRRFVFLKSLSWDILDERNVSRSHYNSFLLNINSSINN